MLATFELASMVCRNMCDKISSKIIVGKSHYSLGKKYCRRCERYMFHEGRFCTCCGMQLRTTPVRTQYKAVMKRTEQQEIINKRMSAQTIIYLQVKSNHGKELNMLCVSQMLGASRNSKQGHGSSKGQFQIIERRK